MLRYGESAVLAIGTDHVRHGIGGLFGECHRLAGLAGKEGGIVSKRGLAD